MGRYRRDESDGLRQFAILLETLSSIPVLSVLIGSVPKFMLWLQGPSWPKPRWLSIVSKWRNMRTPFCCPIQLASLLQVEPNATITVFLFMYVAVG